MELDFLFNSNNLYKLIHLNPVFPGNISPVEYSTETIQHIQKNNEIALKRYFAIDP